MKNLLPFLIMNPEYSKNYDTFMYLHKDCGCGISLTSSPEFKEIFWYCQQCSIKYNYNYD